MNPYGIFIAVVCFVCIGLFHLIVIKAEYYFSSGCWPVFAVLGLMFLGISLRMQNEVISAAMGITGCSCLWSILELKEQEKRVEKGWFPKNPRRGRNYKKASRKGKRL